MAYPDDNNDPFAPFAPQPSAPWKSWEDSPWASYGLQPGQAMPEAGAFQPAPLSPPAETQVPAVDLAPQPAEQLPAMPQPQQTDHAFPALPDSAPVQPGLGIPQQLVESAYASPVPAFPPSRELDQYDADAISGVDALPLPANWNRETGGGYATDDLKPEVDFDTRVENLDWVSRNDPEAYARLQGKQAAAAAEKRAELEEATAREERAAAAAREERSAEAWKRAEARAEENEVEARKLANERIDPDRWWSSRSTGQKIAGFLAAIVGGLVQGRTGSPRNSGLDMINQAIDRDIDAQKANLANRRDNLGVQRGLVADLYARTGDLERSAEIAGIAARQRAMADLERQLGNFDRQGKTAFTIVNTLQAGRAEMAAERQKRIAANQKLQMDAAELELKAMKQAEDERNNRAQNRTANYGIASTNRRADKQLDFDEKKLAADVLKDERKEARDAAAEVRELGMGGSVKVKRDANNAPVIGTDGKPEVERGSLVNDDGKPWKARSKEVADELAKKNSAAADLIDYYDEVAAIRDRTGGEASVFNSDDRQRLDVLEALILKRSKEGTQGMSSDEDMKVLKDAAGAKDVASFRAKAAALEKGREKVIATLNQEMRYRGNYTGDPITFENKYAAAPKNTKEDEDIKTLQRKPAISIGEADRQATAIVKKRITPEDMQRDPTLIKKFSAEVKALKEDYKEISPQQRHDIARLGDIAGGSGPAADRALDDLANLAKDAQTTKIREAAVAAQRSALTSRSGSK